MLRWVIYMVLLVSVAEGYAQDRVYLNDGTVIEGKVVKKNIMGLHVDTGSTGKRIIIPSKRVHKIVYEDGREVIVNKQRVKLKAVPRVIGWRYYVNDNRVSRREFLAYLSDDGKAFQHYVVGRRMMLSAGLTAVAGSAFIFAGIVSAKPLIIVAGGASLLVTAYLNIAGPKKIIKAVNIYNRKIKI
ncbi:MAG: S1 RNA-binding domain-containing protein [Chlorobi bacterium]|nr:S1 RNA-binding domain-containing protein [Chlorobiota bacterium]